MTTKKCDIGKWGRLIKVAPNPHKKSTIERVRNYIKIFRLVNFHHRS